MPLKPPKIETEADVRSGVEYFTGKEVVQTEPQQSVDTRPLPESLVMLLAGAKAAPIKAIDIETSALRPYGGGKILSVAISYDDVNFAFALDHPKAGWLFEQKADLVLWLCDALRDETVKIAHNVSFECEWFGYTYGTDLINHPVWEDTMVQAHILDERVGGLGLDFLCRMHFGIAYKSLFKLNKNDMAASDLKEMLIYNAVDTKYTLRLWHLQNKMLKEQGLYEAYRLVRERQPTVALMQHLGMEVDQNVVRTYQSLLDKELAEINQAISEIPVVKQYTKEKGAFNPLGEDALRIFRDYLKRKEIEVKEEGTALRWSIDKRVLEKINHPLAELIVKLRHLTKMKSTYVDGLELGKGENVWPDGNIHTSFNTCFTETGRTSSDSPNMQNFPKRADSWVRSQVVPPEGHYLVAFDYGSLEACTAAMCSKDPYLVKALWEEYDIHMEFATKMAKAFPQLCPDFKSNAGSARDFRTLIKGVVVFASIFGSQPNSICRNLGLADGALDRFMEDFWKTFSGLGAWQEQVMKTYYKKGWVASPLGRRRRYPLKREQVINHPIQCLAADIVCDGMVRLSKLAMKTGKWYLHPRLNVHDDLSFVIPKQQDVLDEAIETIYSTMLTPQFGDLINVPLSVTASLGNNWNDMIEVGKYWSHRDV